MGAMAAVAEARQCRESQHRLPFYQPGQEREEDQRIFTYFLEDTERRCRERVREERQRRRGLVDRRRQSDDGAGPSNAPSAPTLLCKFYRFKIWDGGTARKASPPIQKTSPTPPYGTKMACARRRTREG
jgi:hypothetical protein